MLFNRQFIRIYYFLFLLTIVLVGGTLGYMVIEEWSLIDSFYMTIITVSTVGYGEVAELSEYGKLFTSFLIMFSFGTFAYVISAITTYIVNGEYKVYYKQYRTMQQVQRLNQHVIICGYGRVGRQVVEDLHAQGYNCLVLEHDKELVESEKGNDDFLILHGDGTDDVLLKKASIETARAVITCLPKDADNIYVSLAARELNSNVMIVSRASSASAVSKLKRAGANNVIMPDSIGGSHMASLIAKPDAMEFIDAIKISGIHESNVTTITFQQLPSSLQNKSIGELESKKTTGVTIIGYKNDRGEYIINPSLETLITSDCKLFILGTTSQIDSFNNYYELNDA
jgi:voltage-gated potassium channel